MELPRDTRVLLRAAGALERLSAAARRLPGSRQHTLRFSAASLWEVAIKSALRREDFRVDPGILRRGLLDNGYVEVPMTGAAVAATTVLPPLHKNPFDRILIAQAVVEGMLLETANRRVAYPDPVRKI